MIRRASVKYAPTTPKVTAIMTGPHAHGCVRCRGRYTDSCTDSRVGGICSFCAGDFGWAELRDNRLPKDCCRAHARPTSREDEKRYALSPACSWFICTACQRTHPFRNPNEVLP